MKLFGKIIGIASIAVLTGVVSALLMSGLVGNHRPNLATRVVVQNWESDWAIGTQATTPYMRAYIARYGVLGLPKSEAVYFIRSVDDAGRGLTETCTYIVSGGVQMAQWWSMTLYNSRGLLPLNEDQAYSLDQTRMGDGDWQAALQSTPPEGKVNWLSTRGAGKFDLMLRVYKPQEAVLARPDKNFNPPSIKRIQCQGEAK